MHGTRNGAHSINFHDSSKNLFNKPQQEINNILARHIIYLIFGHDDLELLHSASQSEITQIEIFQSFTLRAAHFNRKPHKSPFC